MLKRRGTLVKKLDIAFKRKQFALATSAHDLAAALKARVHIC